MRDRLAVLLASAALLCAAASQATPFWGAASSAPIDTPPGALRPGEFVWNPVAAPRGPLSVVVSLDEQRAYVYRNGVLIGYSTVSSGRSGYATPRGVFTVLQKDRDHRSSIYDSAAMPDTMRLTWDGVALHAGGLPGYPSSHGCVHLPSRFADALFDVSPMGMTVVVADAASAPVAVAHPTALAPIDAGTGEVRVEPRLSPDEEFRWNPEKSVAGPVSILLSGRDQRVIVLRNGVEIGRARVGIRDPALPLGAHVLVVGDGEPEYARPWDVRHAPRWIAVAAPGADGATGRELPQAAVERVQAPLEFLDAVGPLLVPGTVLLVTDEPILPQTSGAPLTILATGPSG